MVVARLNEHVAVVTGGASGIGRATVLGLVDEGARVAVVDRDAAKTSEVVNEVSQRGGTARPYVADLADASTLAPMVDDIIRAFGRIDIFVNSAAVTAAPHSAIEFTDEQYALVTAINLRAPFLLTRQIGQHMVERGGGGKIVYVSSSASFRTTQSPAIYAATKAAINGLTRTCAADLGAHDVNVNAVAPGITDTPMNAGLGDSAAKARAAASGPLANLLSRKSEPEDVANVIVFLCLPESRQITGQVINTSAGLVV